MCCCRHWTSLCTCIHCVAQQFFWTRTRRNGFTQKRKWLYLHRKRNQTHNNTFIKENDAKYYVINPLSLSVERIKRPPSNSCVISCSYIHFKIWRLVHNKVISTQVRLYSTHILWLPVFHFKVGKCEVLLHTNDLQGWVGWHALP